MSENHSEHPRFTLNLEDGNWVKQFYDAHARHNQAPYPDYWHADAIMLLSLLTDRKVYTLINGNPLYTQLWSICLGASTTAHKTEALTVAIEYTDPDKDVFPPHMSLTGDWSGAGLFEELSDKPRGYMIHDECASILNRMISVKETGAARDLLCQVYDTKHNIQKRLSSRVRATQNEFNIKQPFIALLWATTPQNFSQNTTLLDITSGWLVRFLYYYPDYNKDPVPFKYGTDYEKGVDEKELLRVLNLIKSRLAERKETIAEIENDSGEYLNSWKAACERKIQTDGNQVIATIHNRLMMMGIKLAILYSLASPTWYNKPNKGTVSVSLEAMKEALREIESYFLPMSLYVYELVERNETQNIQDKIIARIKSNGGKISRRDLGRALHIKSKELAEHLDSLEENGEISVKDGDIYLMDTPQL